MLCYAILCYTVADPLINHNGPSCGQHWDDNVNTNNSCIERSNTIILLPPVCLLCSFRIAVCGYLCLSLSILEVSKYFLLCFCVGLFLFVCLSFCLCMSNCPSFSVSVCFSSDPVLYMAVSCPIIMTFSDVLLVCMFLCLSACHYPFDYMCLCLSLYTCLSLSLFVLNQSLYDDLKMSTSAIHSHVSTAESVPASTGSTAAHVH